MERIISETEVIAFDYLKAFGFSDEQINILIRQGKKDLHNELSKLKILIEAQTVSYDDINNALHALKGLFFQLGNHKIAEQLTEIRSDLERESIIEDLSELLFDENLQ